MPGKTRSKSPRPERPDYGKGRTPTAYSVMSGTPEGR